MITAIVIPADSEEPLRQEQLSASDAAAYREIVGGPLQLIAFDHPRACLYVNEEGKLETVTEVNARATLLAWVHNSALRNRNDVVVGDVVLVGPPDRQGVDLGIPETYVELLFTTMAFKIEVQVHGDEAWYGNEQVFADVFAAYSAGVSLALRWTNVVDVRVVPGQGRLIHFNTTRLTIEPHAGEAYGGSHLDIDLRGRRSREPSAYFHVQSYSNYEACHFMKLR